MSETKTTYLNFYDEITPVKVKQIMGFLSEYISKEKPDNIYCLFASGGGSVDAGIALYNFLRALPIELTMHNTGSIDSIANIIFLSANTRYTSVHSSFMFHGIFHPINASLKKIQLQELLSGINVSESKVAGIISERTNFTTKEIKRLFLQGETKDAPFALKKGLVTEIRDPKIPKDTEILSFNLP